MSSVDAVENLLRRHFPVFGPKVKGIGNRLSRRGKGTYDQ